MSYVDKFATAVTEVKESNVAKTVGSGSLDVFSTPMMVALMEEAACKCLVDTLEDGQTSVGINISVDHLAASPLGRTITATATVLEVDGRKVLFSVSASDGGNEIGKGKHTRVIVNQEKFMSRL